MAYHCTQCKMSYSMELFTHGPLADYLLKKRLEEYFDKALATAFDNMFKPPGPKPFDYRERAPSEFDLSSGLL